MIDAEILIEELVEKHPEAVGFLVKRGVVCIQCGEPVWGTLREAAERKGIEDVEGLVKDLNEDLN